MSAQTIEPCDWCGGAGGLESFAQAKLFSSVCHPCEIRWRVKCAACGHMTNHFCNAALALAVWNERTGQREDKLAG